MKSRQPASARGIVIATARAACLSAGGAAVIAVAGCSGSSGGAAGTAAASGQAATGSASHALSLVASQARRVTSFTAAIDISATGSPSSHLTGTLQEQARPSLLAREAFQVTADGHAIPGGIQALLTGKAVYLKISSLVAMLGKPWVRLSFASLKSGEGVSLAPLIHQMQGGNPLAMAQMFPAASGIRRAGSQVINGVPATEYTGTLHIGAALARIDPGLRKLVGPAMAASGVSTATFRVWADRQHQIRKLVENETGRHYQATTTMVVTSVNQPMHIRVPPASQVAAAPEL